MERLLTLSALPLPPNRNDLIAANRGNKFNGNSMGKNYVISLREAIIPQIPKGWVILQHPVFITIEFHHNNYRSDTSNTEDIKYILDALTCDRQKGDKKNKRTRVVTSYPPPDNSHAIIHDDGPAFIPVNPILLRLPNAPLEGMRINIFDFSSWVTVETKGKTRKIKDQKLGDFARAITGFLNHEV